MIDTSTSLIEIQKTDTIGVKFDNVGFSYPGSDAVILEKISFSIPVGKKVALVGLNGAGKSTLIKLLLRMYDPTSGTISINNQDLKNIKLRSWYDHIRIVFQEFTKYTFLSVRESISLFSDKKDNFSDEEILDLLKKVDGETLIREPGDIDLKQENSYGGRELSGGQSQKISLSRMLAQSGNMIILDEPTSAIDALSEEKIFETLGKLPDTVTMIFISHRFSTIRNADHIIVLDGKTISEQGSHEELLSNNKLYTRMYKTQVLGEK
jgi:ATP-binding cassette subfamily B protein